MRSGLGETSNEKQGATLVKSRKGLLQVQEQLFRCNLERSSASSPWSPGRDATAPQQKEPSWEAEGNVLPEPGIFLVFASGGVLKDCFSTSVCSVKEKNDKAI